MITHTEVRDLIGAELLDSSGIKVGRIGQIYLDESTGELEWATVNTGLFGMNGRPSCLWLRRTGPAMPSGSPTRRRRSRTRPTRSPVGLILTSPRSETGT